MRGDAYQQLTSVAIERGEPEGAMLAADRHGTLAYAVRLVGEVTGFGADGIGCGDAVVVYHHIHTEVGVLKIVAV